MIWFKSLFGGPKTAGPPVPLRRFESGETTVSCSDVTATEAGWLVDFDEQRTVRLFEIENPGVERCLLAYRARLRAEGVRGRAYLEMWCRLPGRGEFFSKGFDQALTGTTGWTSCETPFWLKVGQRPDLIRLNLVVEGAGRVEIADVELLVAPLS